MMMSELRNSAVCTLACSRRTSRSRHTQLVMNSSTSRDEILAFLTVQSSPRAKVDLALHLLSWSTKTCKMGVGGPTPIYAPSELVGLGPAWVGPRLGSHHYAQLTLQQNLPAGSGRRKEDG